MHLAEFDAALECRAEVTGARWSHTGTLDLTVRVRFLHDGHDALVFDRSGAWQPPAPLADDLLGSVDLDASRDLRRDRLDIFLRDAPERDERRVSGRAAPEWRHARMTVDPLKVFGRVSSSRGGALEARLRHAGWSFEVPLRAEHTVLRDAGRSPLLAGRRSQLVLRDDGTVELRREWPSGRVRDLGARVVRRGGSRLRRALARPTPRQATDAATGQPNSAGAHSPGVVSGASRTSTPDSLTVPTHTSSE
jgi:hypothetical protein